MDTAREDSTGRLRRARRWARPRRIVAAVLVLALALALVVVGAALWPNETSPAPEQAESDAEVRAVVLFVGDSNITLGAYAIVVALTDGEHKADSYVPVFASRVGSSIRTYDCPDGTETCANTDFWKRRLRDVLAQVTPDVIVNNLGVNDAATVGTATTPGSASYAEKVDWFMELVPTETPVLWSNLPCAIEPADRAEQCADVNDALEAAPARWENLVLVDWDAVASSHPEYMDSAVPAVHLTPKGRQVWVDLILEELDARFPSL